MKNEMRFQTLIARDVPAELDRRILAAASKRAAELRFRHARRRWFWAGSATAAASPLKTVWEGGRQRAGGPPASLPS